MTRIATRIAIVQSCYIPWKGYFDMIRRCDRFVLYDCVQYTTRDWRNRNRIKTPDGLHWLTIAVKHMTQTQRIIDTMLQDHNWQRTHWETLRHYYSKAPYFSAYSEQIHALYESCTHDSLSAVNLHFLQGITAILGITTPITLLSEFPNGEPEDATEKLISICEHFGATHYLSGPSAKDYMELGKFNARHIEVEWMDYSHYQPYAQFYPPFEHGVSILDLLFHTGPDWARYLTAAT